jgi:hypothetical protein
MTWWVAGDAAREAPPPAVAVCVFQRPEGRHARRPGLAAPSPSTRRLTTPRHPRPLPARQAWFITPEFPQASKRLTLEAHVTLLKEMIEQMRPKVLMYMVHNGHLPEESWQLVRAGGCKGRGPGQ